VPPKRDDKGWKRLGARVAKIHAEANCVRFDDAVQRNRELELQIHELQRRAKNVGREKHIKELKKKLEKGG